MKLATLRNRTRDGRLVVVSRDLTMCTEVGHIVATMQAALDDWAHVAPRLERVAQGLETGSQPTFRFHEHEAMSPLPRAYRRIDAATGRDGGSGALDGPRDPVSVIDGSISACAGIGVIVGDVAAGAGEEEAREAIRLIVLIGDIGLDEGGMLLGSAFSPVAVSPDELGDAWDGRALKLPLALRLNDRAVGNGASAARLDFTAAIVAAARHRPLHAGTLVTAQSAPAGTPLSAGGALRIEMKDSGGHSIFGAIERNVVPHGNDTEDDQKRR